MDFKKDYINYILHNLLEKNSELFRNKKQLEQIFRKIILINELAKIVFVLGKTEGLEKVFKYFLYISDKIDKSLINIFNLKENSDYDEKQLCKICSTINETAVPDFEEAVASQEILDEEIDKLIPEDDKAIKTAMIIERELADEEAEINETEEKVTDSENSGMMLIENEDADLEEENFELTDLSTGSENVRDITEEESVHVRSEENDEDDDDENIPEDIVNSEEKNEYKEDEKIYNEVESLPVTEVEIIVKNEVEENVNEGSEEKSEIDDLEIEIKKANDTEDDSNDESHVNEAYYRFEERFFIESKILEKLFSGLHREIRKEPVLSLNEMMTGSCAEIIGITTSLSNMTRKLSFDLTADILMTMGLYFSRVIKYPYTLTRIRLELMKDSLKLIGALVRNENYLNYDKIIDLIEEVKAELMSPPPEPPVIPVEKKPAPVKQQEIFESEKLEAAAAEADVVQEKVSAKQPGHIQDSPARTMTDEETVIFKMKYLVKEFEKNFESLGSLTGEYSKFEALESIDGLNNYLRLLAKMAGSMDMLDVVKLSEVTYVFLKYIKDYRMNLLDPESQQIIKYVIFSFKMLLTNRKPEDFNVLVDYLNNPVKIFADS